MILRLLACATALALALPAAAEPVLFTRMNGYTLDGSGALQRFDALLVDEDGRVVATGGEAALRERAGEARIESMAGRTVLPGLTDAHGHLMGLGFALRQADLVGTRSLDEALERVRAFASARPGDGWIVGNGWNQVIWQLGRFPTASELDAVVADRPVWLERVDGHAGWANSAALKLAGIDRHTPDPVGGRIERDADGHPGGVLVDAAMGLVSARIPPADAAEARAALESALVTLASLGLTSVHDAGIDADNWHLFRQMADADRLSLRIYAMVRDTGEDFDQIAANGPLLASGNDHLTVRSVKMWADGALGSRGAAMIEPYSDDPHNHGLLFRTPAELRNAVDKAFAQGFQVNIHAIGDAGVRQVLDAYSIAYKAHPEARGLRNRVEHSQIAALADIPRYLPLQLIASMQPTHATSDMNMAEDRVGPQRILGGYAWRRFLDQGTRIAGGSDFPVELPNPFFGLHAAVTRQDHENHPDGGWYADQRMTREEALRAFTLDAAWAAHQEARQGTLEPGKWADFIVIDRDYFSIPAEDIWKIGVLQTWVGGKQVFLR